MNYKNVIKEFFGKERIFLDQRKSLIVLLGSFADFDSFEYSQQLSSQLNKLAENSLILSFDSWIDCNFYNLSALQYY